MPNWWEWENKLLNQEVDYFADQKEKLRLKMISEIQQRRVEQSSIAGEANMAHIIHDIEVKY